MTIASRVSLSGWRRAWPAALLTLLCLGWSPVWAKVIDLATREGVTQRILFTEAQSKAIGTLVVMPGGHGGIAINAFCGLGWGRETFLVRNVDALSRAGLNVILVDAPSDKTAPRFLQGHRQRPEHVTDVRAVLRWARERAPGLPVWLAGFSRGTQSAAFVTLRLGNEADSPDGLVLAGSIVADREGRPLPDMPLDRIRVPVLVVHHEADGCEYCPYARVAPMMDKLVGAPKKELLTYRGGTDHPDLCGPLGHHGFAGLDETVIADIARWLASNAPKR